MIIFSSCNKIIRHRTQQLQLWKFNLFSNPFRYNEQELKKAVENNYHKFVFVR